MVDHSHFCEVFLNKYKKLEFLIPNNNFQSVRYPYKTLYYLGTFNKDKILNAIGQGSPTYGPRAGCGPPS